MPRAFDARSTTASEVTSWAYCCDRSFEAPIASWLDDEPGATLTRTIVEERNVSFISWLAP